MTSRSLFQRFKHFYLLQRALQRHPKAPAFAKLLPWMALLYLILPIDFIPDILPFFGQLDDLILVPFLLNLALWILSSVVRDDLEREASNKDHWKEDAILVTPR